jgi:hypothetical protein
MDGLPPRLCKNDREESDGSCIEKSEAVKVKPAIENGVSSILMVIVGVS